MGIASGRPRFEAELALKRFRLHPYFNSVVTLDECEEEENCIFRSTGKKIKCSKPHPYSILRAVQEIGIPHPRCGYVGDAAKMQYTANSFVRMYRKLAESVLLVQRTKVEIKEVFPQKIMHYETHIGDILETNLIDQPLVWTKRLFASFHFLQNGKIQNYILYGIVFMLTVALLTWLKLL